MTEEHPFELSVVFRGKELLLPGKLIQFGYTYKIYVQTEHGEIIFEPDEERNFRAVVEGDDARKIPPELVRIVAEELDRQLR